MNKAEYQRYLQSTWWRERSRIALAMSGHRCEFCPTLDLDRKAGDVLGQRCMAAENLDVHHRNYNRLGAERDADLEVLCRRHHLARHGIYPLPSSI